MSKPGNGSPSHVALVSYVQHSTASSLPQVERAAQLAHTVCEDLKDPFRVVDIAGDVLKGDPARLADEFSAMSLMGGRRVVRVRPAGEESAAALENLVARHVARVR